MPGIRTVLMMAGLLPVISFHIIAPGASAAGAGRQGRTPRISAAAAQPVDVLGAGGGPAGLAAATSLAAVVVVVGATGGTGLRAIRGFLDVGYEPGQLRVLTRSPDKPACLALKGVGVQVVAADLDDSATLAPALRGATSIYCHSTADDTHKLETAEMERARSLAAAAVACGTVRLLVYNSAAQTNACPRVDRIAQKHQVEAIFRAQTQLPCTVLRASLFMEEFWKRKALASNAPRPRPCLSLCRIPQMRMASTPAARHLPPAASRPPRRNAAFVLEPCAAPTPSPNPPGCHPTPSPIPLSRPAPLAAVGAVASFSVSSTPPLAPCRP